MRAIIQYSRILRRYFWFPDIRDKGKAFVASNRREIERIAKQNGATEIIHMVRSTTKDLERYGHYDHEAAKRAAKDYR